MILGGDAAWRRGRIEAMAAVEVLDCFSSPRTARQRFGSRLMAAAIAAA